MGAEIRVAFMAGGLDWSSRDGWLELYACSSICVYLACLLVCMGLTTDLCAIWMGFILASEDVEVTIRRPCVKGCLVEDWYCSYSCYTSSIEYVTNESCWKKSIITLMLSRL